MTRRVTFAFALPLLALAGCGGSTDEDAKQGGYDPASDAALNANLMTDPDLADSNEAAATLSGTGNQAIPPIDTSPAALAAARKRAAELVGGELPPLGQPHTLPVDAPDTPAMVMAARAAVSPGGANCAASLAYSAAWAAKLPASFPVYPRGNTVEAAGSDEGACALRIVTFRTGVPLEEVLRFYAARAKSSGFGVDYARKGGDVILSGTRGEAAYVVYGRQISADAVTEIDLVTSGG